MIVLLIIVFFVIMAVVMLSEASQPIMKEPWDWSKRPKE